MANHELSGPIMMTLIYQYLKNKFNLNPKTFTYGWRANKYNEVLKLQQSPRNDKALDRLIY